MVVGGPSSRLSPTVGDLVEACEDFFLQFMIPLSFTLVRDICCPSYGSLHAELACQPIPLAGLASLCESRPTPGLSLPIVSS